MKIKFTHIAAAGIALALSSSVLAAGTPSLTDTSYALGWQFGNSLKTQSVALSTQEFEKGLSIGLSGQKSRFTKKQVQALLQQFQMTLMAKQKQKEEALAKVNAAQSLTYINKIKSENGVHKLTDGVYYKVVKAGNGPVPKATDTVQVQYKGTLTNGKEFDSSYARKEPAEFKVNQVIPGWTKALQKMPVGSTWELYLSPKQAYGLMAPPSIGPNQALIFKVELLKIMPSKGAKTS